MADAIVSTPATAPLPAAGGSAPVAVTVVSGSTKPLPEGTLIEAQVQTRAAKGLLEVVTANGVLQIKAAPGTTLPVLSPGSKLTLQVIGQGDTAQLFVVGVNGRALGGGPLLPNLTGLLNQGGATAGSGQIAAGHPTGVIGQPQPIGAGTGILGTPGSAALDSLGLTATVIRPANPGGISLPGQPAQALPQGMPADLPAGTRLTVRIADVQSPATPEGGAPMAPAQPGQGATAGVPANTPPLPEQPATAPPQPRPGPPPAGGGLTPQITLPGDGSAPTIVLSGTVTAHPPNGQAVVQTQIATLSVPTHADLPVGTRLTLEVVGNPQPPLPASSTAPRAEGLTSAGWPALTDALDTLASANQPQALEQLLRAIPQPDGRLAASMVAFTGAVRAGSTRSLVPENAVRGLEKAGKKEVAGRLTADLEALTEESGRPVGNGDWRAYTMPMLHGGVVEPVRLFVRKGGEDGGGGRGGIGDKPNDHRFVLDFNLTQLGRLQLDGLVRREDKLFDLIIRSGEPMSTDMRRDILAIFHDASELVGTKGTVSFQAGGRWMEFPPAPPAPTRIEV